MHTHKVLRHRHKTQERSKAQYTEPKDTVIAKKAQTHSHWQNVTGTVHENGTKEGWAHKIDTGRDAVMITELIHAEGHTKYSNDSCVTNGTSEGLNFMKALKSPCYKEPAIPVSLF